MGHIVYVLDTKQSGVSVWDNASYDNPASKVHGPNMGPIWGRQDPGGPHVGPMNFAIGEDLQPIVATSVVKCDHFNTQSCGFDTFPDFRIRRPIGFRNRLLGPSIVMLAR